MWRKEAAFIIAGIGLLLSEAQSSVRSIPQSDLIRVRMHPGIAQVSIRGLDLVITENHGNGMSIRSQQATDQSQWYFECAQGFVHGYRLGTRKAPFWVVAPMIQISSPAHFFTWEAKTMRQQLQIYPRKDRCEVVQVVDLDKYLASLVATEFSPAWNENAIAAQIIVARSYALVQMQRARMTKNKSHYDVEATIADQLYEGFDREDPRAHRIVERTKGWVLVDPKNDDPFETFYHSTCGGRTTRGESVFPNVQGGKYPSVRCPYCRFAPKYSWTVNLSPLEIRKTFAHYEGITGDLRSRMMRSTLHSIRPTAKDETGRILGMEIKWTEGFDAWEQRISGSRFRSAMGIQKFLSTAFTWKRERNGSYVFTGHGNGHGVGMCQWGAKIMGDLGFKSGEILKYYYPKALLKKI